MLNLLVLRAADITVSRSFYETLGLTFIEEQHGSGPIHYSCEIGALVIEIFPGKPGSAPERRQAGADMLGFRVADLDSVVAKLEASATVILTPPQDSAWGRRAVIQDPDGRSVEITQAAPTS